MRLDPAEIAQLPLAAALVDQQGGLIAATPEWTAPSPGTVSFHTGFAQLLVAVDAGPPELDVLITRLLDELAAGRQPGADGLRVELLAEGLRLMAGRPVSGADRGGADRVFQLAMAGISARTQGVRVVAMPPPSVEVPAPAAIALAMVQLAVNANRHELVEQVWLRVAPGPTFYVEWAGERDTGVHVASHRHQELRRRWGWGYVQMIADALGATALPPGPTGPRTQGACLGLGSIRLTLPLCCVQGGVVTRSTEAWDQELEAPPGTSLTGPSLALLRAAGEQPGRIVEGGLLRARCWGSRTWLAMPPQDGANRARDVLRGLLHERALLTAPEPHATRIQALATLLGVMLGEPWPSVPPAVWEQVAPLACAALGVPAQPLPDALVLPDPRLAAYLLAEVGGDLVEVGDTLQLRPAGHENRQLLAALPRTPEGFVRLT